MMKNKLLIFLLLFSLSTSSLFAKKTLKIGVYENKPKIFTNKNGKTVGFWADITKYIAAKENWQIEWVIGNWEECLQRLENNEIDIMVDVGESSARKEKFIFSKETVLLSWTVLYTQKGTDLKSIFVLEGKTIACLKESINLNGPQGLKATLKNFDINCKIIEMQDYSKVFEAISKGDVFAGITNKDFGAENENKYNVQRSPLIFQPVRLQFAFPKKSNLTPEFIEKIDNHIIRLKKNKDSIYYSSLAKYLGGGNKITIFPFWLKTSFIILFIATIISFFFILLLKQQVNHKTWQLQKDIAQREKIEKNLKESNIKLMRAKKKAEESDHLKSAFLANISHEIRTPMNGILGFTELLKEPDLVGDKKQEYINIIEKSGNRMLNIINDLIDISKIESGQMDISIKKTSINEAIKYIYTFFKPEVETKGMQLLFKNPLYENDVTIETDPEKFYAILINLVKNAIKYSNKGIIEFGYEEKENYLIFFVKDSGIGIAKDRQKAIFERFVQSDISTSRNYEGAGLGLSISKAYVKMLGGKIWVESEIGKGSQFYFTIPHNTNFTIPHNTNKKEIIIPVNTNSEIQTENQIKNLNVLIAEDEETSDIYLTTVIKKYCKKIIHSKTGIEAVEACRQHKDIDLILMDIKMLEMNGYEATRKIREFNKNVIIIAQTAYALTDDREDALVAGCDDYISKPINKNKLLKIIGKNLRKKINLT